ncbi:hypothetical protein AK95_00525 [Paenibacillus sp. LC231]|uniref:DUF4179 domain-containing protein n=1 Tax=Paenibacillus sp. LC231 TaxID=1120679 RepID=UPI0008DCA095|nr:DUF4179 domain-containing protein [Paenibacillus sp. LC231]OIB00932.1 hypothetical protein AK95_00525 [Paenibacillus sp. LC231]
MNPFDLDKELREIGKVPQREVPDIIRRHQDEVYASLTNLPMSTRTNQQQRSTKKRRMVAVAAAVAMIAVISSAYVSPAVAESLKKIPLISSIFRLADDLGLQIAGERGLAAESNASVTHEGVTLRIPQVVYDGTRLSLAVKREGEGFTGRITDVEVINEGKGTSHRFQRGAITDVEMLIDGTSIHDLSLSDKPGLIGKPTSDPNVVMYELIGFSRLNHSPSIPDQFQLTAKISLEGIDAPYIFHIPVRKNTDQIIVSSGETREWNGLQISLEQLKFTPITTDLIMNLERLDKSGKLGDHNLLFEVWDDRGRELGRISGKGVYRDDRQQQQQLELIFDRFEVAPDSITIKPFLPVFQDPIANSGLYKVDSKGEVVKTYLKELEITIPVNHLGLDKLYDVQW